jgi:hypothetical protein
LWAHGACWIGRIWLFAGSIALAMADDSVALKSLSDQRSFDIPSQSLATALSSYSSATGVGVLVDGDVTVGRVSAPVKGAFMPAVALQAMLENTGLTARYVTPTAFTLVPAAPEQGGGAGQYREHYFALIQAAVVRALCKRTETRPGQFRSALRLWIDRSGLVQRSEMLSSTGRSDRDVAIDELLKNLSIGARPTFDLPQPVTVILLQRGQDAAADCPALDAGLRR